jgi:nucleoside-diphosphate-sugar epimerase
MKTVLIVGASGLVGTAAANSFNRAGWRVLTCSRRPPQLVEDQPFRHIYLDIMDKVECETSLAEIREPITHLVYAAVQEVPGLIPGWGDPSQIHLNGQMLTNVMEPLLRTSNLEHVTILQGTKAYGGSVAQMRIPAKESQTRVEHPNFYWLHEDYVRKKAVEFNFSFTILRPQLIVGPNHGVVMNLPPVLGVYAAMKKWEGLPMSFPGGPEWVWEAVDARLVGDACLWAASSQKASGQTFNLTNGEVFSWRDMWPAIADTLKVKVGADEPQSVADYLNERVGLWPAIVSKYNLNESSLASILGESHYYADLCFAYGLSSSPPATFLSTVTIKQAGFSEVYDTEKSFCYWLRDLQRRKIVPD